MELVFAHITADLAGAAPEWIMLFPRAGTVKARDGRVFVADDLHGIVETTRRYHGATDAVVDYHHQTEQAQKSDLRAKAAGWVKEWKVGGPNGEDGIWARVEWTDAARQAIDAREFRYISPTFFRKPVKKQSDPLRIVGIWNVALLNNPALTMPALAGANPEGDPSMDELKKLLEALGLDPDTDIDKAVETAKAMAAGHEHLTAAVEAAGVKTTNELPGAVKSLAEKVEAAEAGGTGTETAVADLRQQLETANAQVTKLTKDLATLQTAHATDKATASVEAAIGAGKLAPAQKDWALDYAKANPDGFAAFVKAQPTIVKPGRDERSAADPSKITVAEEDKAAAASMGLDLDDKDQLEQWQKAAAQIQEELNA